MDWFLGWWTQQSCLVSQSHGLLQAGSPALMASVDLQALQALARPGRQMEGPRGGVTAQAGGPCRGARRTAPLGSRVRGTPCRHRWPA